MRNTMRNWMLGTALIAGLLGTGAVSANAASWGYRGPVARGYYRGPVRVYERPGFVVGRPVVEGYVPPCPGDGYEWIGGAWVFRGRPEVFHRYAYGPAAHFDHGFERGFRR